MLNAEASEARRRQNQNSTGPEKLAQEQLAKIAEVSPRTIQRVEAGRNASYETLRSIASAFEIEVKELLKEQPVTTPLSAKRRCRKPLWGLRL